MEFAILTVCIAAIVIVPIVGIIAIISVLRKQSSSDQATQVTSMRTSPFPESSQANTDRAFLISQLIGGERFLRDYYNQLTALHQSKPFQVYLNKLRKELNGQELIDTKNANRIIADSFFHSRINDRFPAAAEITAKVKQYGKQASAHISIYYAMYILDEKQSL